MRIESFWAKGFRSLRDVRMDGLGPFTILYGPNGSGKSNILAAIQTLIRIVDACSVHLLSSEPGHSCSYDAEPLRHEGIVQRRDLFARDDARRLVLGARFVDEGGQVPILASGPLKLTDLTIEVTLDWVLERDPRLSMSVSSGGADVRLRADFAERRNHLQAILTERLPTYGYRLIGANRFLYAEGRDLIQGAPVERLLDSGLLQLGLLTAQTSSNHLVRRRFQDLRSLLMGPPLDRPPFDLVVNEQSNTVELHEQLPGPNPEGLAIPLDLAGLGIAQMYMILARVMLSGARAVAIEEPEAHLHAPTSGLHLRELLRRMVNEKHIDQLFVATHSNLFDLDPGGYWDVSLEDGETRVKRAALHEIDAKHLYEPGPTLHALEELLATAPADKVVFRRADGSPVMANQMVTMLRGADPIALDYLRNLHAAALDVVGLRSRKGKSA